MTTSYTSYEKAIVLTAAYFERYGCNPQNAASVAQALVDAEMDGLNGHGLSRLSSYRGMLESGKVDGKANCIGERTAPGVLSVDASRGFAYPAIDLAVDLLPDIANGQGIAAAAIRRSNHAGAIGHPVERLARKGLVALMFANSPGAMAPWGGRTPVFGTNPIAFSAPLTGSDPIVIDLSLSRVARGTLLTAKQKRQRIPEGWALDPDGNPTNDPDAGLAGTMLPMGDAKGAALALMVEVLSACIPGARLAFEASSFLDKKGPPPETGQFIIAISSNVFGENHFSARIIALAAAINEQAGARLPGSRRFKLRAENRARGIQLPEEIKEHPD
jgi:(2R)-3-sulfolactate dehydrogenase (NADP+)